MSQVPNSSNDQDPPARPLAERPFRAYIASTGLSRMAFSIQYLLLSWMLVGVLQLPADTVGLLQALIGLPGLALMLWGGASADRSDARHLLIVVYGSASVIPMAMLAIYEFDAINVTSVVVWGLGMSVVTAFSVPGQQTVLNRVSGADVQRGVSLATAIGFLVQVAGLTLAGQQDRIGLAAVLAVQSICLVLAAVTIRHVPAQAKQTSTTQISALKSIALGFKATYADKNILHVFLINFVSSIFNGAAFMTVVPFIVTRVYVGDAQLMSITMAVFYGGAMLSNVLLFKLMPFVRPGRLFLLMQLSRSLILFALWIEPSFLLAALVIFTWGLNMGFTTTLARTVVQESAAPAFRGRILSVFALGMVGSAPLGAVILGNIVETFGTMNGLIPAMVTSLVLCVLGVTLTGVWRYRSPEPL